MSNLKSHDPTVIAPAPSKGYLAHVRRNEDGSFEIHHLEEHLRAVGDLAGEFASTFGHSDWGRQTQRRPRESLFAPRFTVQERLDTGGDGCHADS